MSLQPEQPEQPESPNVKVIARGVREGNLYKLCASVGDQQACTMVSSSPESTGSVDLWHQCLGHTGVDNIKLMKNQQMVKGLDLKEIGEPQLCQGCIMGKLHRTKFPRIGARRATKALELVHTNVCGPMKNPTHGGARYILAFVDDFTRRSWTYLLKEKSEVFKTFKEWKTLVEKKSGECLKTLRSDNGGEYIPKQFKSFCKEHGIRRQLTINSSHAGAKWSGGAQTKELSGDG